MLRELKRILPYVDLFRNSMIFAIRRTFRKVSNYAPEFSIIVTGIDHTLIDGSMIHEVLTDKFGAKKADETMRELQDFQKVDLKGDRWLLAAIYMIIDLDVSKQDYFKTLNRLNDEGKIKMDIIEILQDQIDKGNKKVIVITKGSPSFVAEWFAQKHGFHAGYGHTIAEHSENDKGEKTPSAVIELIGEKNGVLENVPVRTKLNKVREFCKLNGIVFDKKRVALIADDHFDSKEMLECFGILIVPNKEPTKDQMLASRFGLCDVKVEEAHEHAKLHLVKVLSSTKKKHLPRGSRKGKEEFALVN